MPKPGTTFVAVSIALFIAGMVTQVQAATVSVRVTDRSGNALAGVAVVALTRSNISATTPVFATLNQQDLKFVPEVLVVQTGTEVTFPNKDKVMHHVYSFSQTKTFEIPLYQAMLPPPVAFDTPGVAVIGCNIHDQMIARILIVDTPYFATTDTDGKVELDILEQEIESLVAWHPSWGEFGADQMPWGKETQLEWKVDHDSAGRLKPGALAWNEDY